MGKHAGQIKVDNPFGWVETDNEDEFEDNLLELASLLNEYLTPESDIWDSQPQLAREDSIRGIRSFLRKLEGAMIEELDMLDPR